MVKQRQGHSTDSLPIAFCYELVIRVHTHTHTHLVHVYMYLHNTYVEKVKAELSLRLTKHHAMKMYGEVDE
jgi:hypothetical protein